MTSERSNSYTGDFFFLLTINQEILENGAQQSSQEVLHLQNQDTNQAKESIKLSLTDK